MVGVKWFSYSVFLFLFTRINVKCGNILAVVPTSSYSHQVAFQSLWAYLSHRGHKIVVLTTDAVNNSSLVNLTEIEFKHSYKEFEAVDFVRRRYHSSWIDIMHETFWDTGYNLAKNIFDHPDVEKMYRQDSNYTFDLVIAEAFFTPSIYALAHVFKAPLIGISSIGVWNYQHFNLGAPILSSHPSTWELGSRTDLNLSFWKRMNNFFKLWSFIYHTINVVFPKHQKLAEKYLGSDIPNVIDMERNISLILTCEEEVFSFNRPKTPNVIMIGAFHLKQNNQPFDLELQQFIDSADKGFIYVSFGTNVKIKSLNEREQSILLHSFSHLPYKVIWKTDIDVNEEYRKNIYAKKWLPQQSILAHPKIKLFVYQGGLQSTGEAVNNGVPVVGMPILADQDQHINELIALGVATRVDLVTLTKENLMTAINEVLNNSKFSENMKKLKKLMKDKPHDSLEYAIWWIEYVMRHKGAPHLACSLKNEPWYKRQDLDIILFLSFLAVLALFLSFYVCYNCMVFIHKFLIKNKKIKLH